MRPAHPAPLVWDDTYALGYSRLDGEHRYLVTLVNRGLEELAAGQEEDFRRTLVQFIEICRHHFFNEEQLLEDIGFPGRERHRRYHTKLLDMAGRIAAEAPAGAETEQLRARFEALAQCLLDDVIRGDREFLPFLAERGLLD